MTYRDRREARAERLRGWAEKREVKAATAFGEASQINDMIPFGQPILIGHHSEGRHRRDLGRIDSSMRRGVEHSEKARSMASRADNIESQLDRSIYSDDPDATERLRERIVELEAKRGQMKTANATYRKEHKAELAAMTPYERHQAVPFPAYALTNLSGNIARNRKRLAALEAR